MAPTCHCSASWANYRSRRSEAAINGREKRFCALKGNLSLKGKGPQGSGSQSSWGEEARGGKGKGKPRVAMEAWANRDATADAPSTVVETTWSGWGGFGRGEGPRRERALDDLLAEHERWE